MNLAMHAWEAGGVGRVRELLEQHRPKDAESDLRGFEWYYLYRLCHAELLTLKGTTNSVKVIAFSPDGKRLATANADETANVWDAESGKELLTLRGHSALLRVLPSAPMASASPPPVQTLLFKCTNSICAYCSNWLSPASPVPLPPRNANATSSPQHVRRCLRLFISASRDCSFV